MVVFWEVGDILSAFKQNMIGVVVKWVDGCWVDGSWVFDVRVNVSIA